MRIAYVVAVAENGVIGQEGKLPWRLSSDLKFFRRITIGKPVIMGRKTYESIGKPLDGRDNIVLTRQDDFSAPQVHVAHSADEAVALARRLAQARGADEIAVIGGAEIYRLLMPHADRIYLTRVHASPEGDAMFAVDPELWKEFSREELPRGAQDTASGTLITLDRRA